MLQLQSKYIPLMSKMILVFPTLEQLREMQDYQCTAIVIILSRIVISLASFLLRISLGIFSCRWVLEHWRNIYVWEKIWKIMQQLPLRLLGLVTSSSSWFLIFKNSEVFILVPLVPPSYPQRENPQLAIIKMDAKVFQHTQVVYKLQ